MASDLSSGCTEVIEILDEKEEGEISLEDVSSSEEGQLNEGCHSRQRATGQCPCCLSTKHCASWCTIATRTRHSKSLLKKDAVQEKENCLHTKDSGYSSSKHPTSTLQESNNDLIPISSDSDMEIVGLADNVKPVMVLPKVKTTKVRKRRKKKRSQNSSSTIENATIIPPNLPTPECSFGLKHDAQVLKDNHLPRVHHRESNSPHKSITAAFTRSRTMKSPSRRHRSPIGRARTPFGKSRSPVLRKSPIRRLRSPVRRSSPHSPIRSPIKRQLRDPVSPSNTYIDMYGNVSKLLKKVRHLRTIGSHLTNQNSGTHKEHVSSLKEKLNNMMKGTDTGENGNNETTSKRNNEQKLMGDDDDEDLEILRQMALETKPKRVEKCQRTREVKDEVHCGNNNIGDDDDEDLELRLIALRSAMLKKHRDRKQRGVITGKSKKSPTSTRTNTESPFSQSFLDGIPIPDEGQQVGLHTPPRTVPHTAADLNENTNPEDMELDSEVEQEKNKEAEPYSPTDEVSHQITIDTELLDIQPLDASFITPTSENTVLSVTSSLQTPLCVKLNALETGASYLPNGKECENNSVPTEIPYYLDTNMHPRSQSHTSSVPSPVNTQKTSTHEALSNNNLPITPYSPSDPIDTPEPLLSPVGDPFFKSVLNQIPDTPYSPTDTPVYEPEWNNSSTVLGASTVERLETIQLVDRPKEQEDMRSRKPRVYPAQNALIQINLDSSFPTNADKSSTTIMPQDSSLTSQISSKLNCAKVDMENDFASETSSMKADVGSAGNSPDASPDSTMIVVDELPDTDLDGSLLVPVPKALQDIEVHIPNAINQEIFEIAQEPLYLHGVPDVTKDFNKIPTLVNRSLVPASILKSNKNLQQPLPPKKVEAHLEPAFRSAQMQPVQILPEPSKTNRMFIPIKIAPVAKKPQLRIVTPAAFNCSSNDNSILEDTTESGSVKEVPATCKEETGNFSEHLQHQQPRIRWDTSNTIESGNSFNIQQPMKASELLSSEHNKDLVDNQLRNDVTSTAGKRVSGLNMEENLVKPKRRRSKRSRSGRNRSKRAKSDVSIEATNTIFNTPKVIVSQKAVNANIATAHKHSQNSKTQDRNRKFESPVKKKRNSKDKSNNSVVNNTKRDREKRSKSQSFSESENKWRSKPSYDESSSSHRKSDSNNLADRNTDVKKQLQKNKESMKKTECAPQNDLVTPECVGDNRFVNNKRSGNHDIAKQPEAILDTHGNTLKSDKLTATNTEQCLSKSCKASATTHDTKVLSDIVGKFIESPAPVVSISGIQDTKDSMSTNTCKKLEGNKRRRSSLDEDEEALRAILLASLAKRKPSETANGITMTPPPTTSPTTTPPTTTAATITTPILTTTPLANLSHSSGNTSLESGEGIPDVPSTKLSVTSVYSSSNEATPPPIANNHSSTKNSFSKNPASKTLAPSGISNTVPATTNSFNNLNNNQIIPLVGSSRKRSIPAVTRSHLKKITKKSPISASTRVVNNAKKYQNTLIQKKLNLQKVAMLTSAQQTLGRTNLHNNKLLDGNRPSTILKQPLSDTHRFVINLASDSESENETESQNINNDEADTTDNRETKPPLAIPMSDFEKSVDMFLKDVRRKQENAAAVKPNLSASAPVQKPSKPVTAVHRKSPVLSTTPLAVRHLPAPLQEEYRRLKQQIIEREKLKLHRVLVNNTSPSSPNSKSSGTPPGPLSPASSIDSPQTSKQPSHIPSTSQSPKFVSVKANNTRSSSSETNAKISPVISKSNAVIPPISNLSIQIPNENTNNNLASKKSSNLYIPVSGSQSRLVTTSNKPEDAVNTKKPRDSTIPAKDQSSLKVVQIQLQQGKTGRTVILGENFNTATKTMMPQSEYAEAQDSGAVKTLFDDDLKKTATNMDYSVDTSASTVIISREENDAKDRTSVDSSASTIIIPRNEILTKSISIDSMTSTVIFPKNDHADSFQGESSVSSGNNNVNSSKLSTSRSKKFGNSKEIWEKIRSDVKKELDAISVSPINEQKTYLATIEQNLVKKRYAILDDLSEFSGSLHQLEMEREVQANMASEVKKLQEQLRCAEERLQEQRSRVNKMVPSITAAYEKFNGGRRDCVKMTRICLGLGCLVVGADYKVPAAGAQLLNNRLKQVAGCTRQLSKKKVSSTEKSETKIMGNTDKVPGKIDSPSQTRTLDKENSSNNASFELTRLTIGDNDSSTTGKVTVIENCVLSDAGIVSAEIEETEATEQKVECLENTAVESTIYHIELDSPQVTSTPNSTRECSCIDKHTQESAPSSATLILESPKAGLSGHKNSQEQSKFLQPYKSVLAHLTVPRTTDPTGILCPYELMGTCRDEDCQFVHQSARNGNASSEVQYATAKAIPLVAATTPRDGKLSSYLKGPLQKFESSFVLL